MLSKILLSRAWRALLALVVMLPALSWTSAVGVAQEAQALEGVAQAKVVPTAIEETEFLSAPPELTDAQIADLQAKEALINRSGPDVTVSSEAVAGPESGQETIAGREAIEVKGAPQANGTFTRFTNRNLTSSLPANSESNVSEVSVDGAGKVVFATGNWWAARSIDDGATWSYIDPYTLADFCCDQVVIYDKARNLLLWERMTVVNNGASENQYYIGASINRGASFCYYPFASPAGEWYDYPHWTISNDYLWLATNLFSTTTGLWVETRVLKLPLDALRDCLGFGYSYHFNTAYFNATPVSGATDTMYWGTHQNTSRLRIYSWQEDSGSVAVTGVDIPAWTNTNRGDAYCGNARNWGGRTDARILTGWVSRGVIGFMWNVQEGGGFTYPYVNAATFDEATKAYIGRPFVFNGSYCWLYPSMAVNSRGDLGLVVNGGTRPNIYAALDDDYNGAPPGWEVLWIANSSYLPSDSKWGDYNTSRPNHPASVVFRGGSHVLQTRANCCKASPYTFVYGRERDRRSWNSWDDK